MLLADLLPLAAETEVPIAVVEDDRLVGVVPRVSLLEALSNGQEV
jgi:glycine betaine/proline transport system ATP-binding protein